ncbi:hypothetical protein EKN26_22950 [Enterobacter bugandensis]|nr:hypothetical protein EKN26_22950 [Enterobacter bugandensis]
MAKPPSIFKPCVKVSFAKKLAFSITCHLTAKPSLMASPKVNLLRCEIKLSPFHDTRKWRKLFKKIPLVTPHF